MVAIGEFVLLAGEESYKQKRRPLAELVWKSPFSEVVFLKVNLVRGTAVKGEFTYQGCREETNLILTIDHSGRISSVGMYWANMSNVTMNC